MKRCRSFSTLIFFLACASIASIVYGAGVPNTLNYQGTLTDSTGKPVTATAKPVTFKLYTSALGGTAFWAEPQTVPITNGQFSVVFGSTVPLPPDKFTGSTYVGVTVDPGAEMLPRQKLTSVAYALKAADAIPKGVIVMWSGTMDQIPEGWALCDGVERSLLDGSKVIPPNLKDRFVVGVGDRFGSGKTKNISGGEEGHVLTVDEMPFHSHGGTSGNDTPDHIHYDAGHAHSSPWRDGTGGTNGFQTTLNVSGYLNIISTGYSNIGGASTRHTHSISGQGGGTEHNNLPPYYALAFIMKL